MQKINELRRNAAKLSAEIRGLERRIERYQRPGIKGLVSRATVGRCKEPGASDAGERSVVAAALVWPGECRGG